MSIKDQLLQKKILWHLGALFLFLSIASFYMSPTFSGDVINQADVVNWSGAAQEIMDYREKGEEVLWTNSMFSGMPSIQISTKYSGLGLLDQIKGASVLWLPQPVNHLFLYFIGFYILALVLKIRPGVALIGAIAYGLSSYFIIILQAGHVTKAVAIGYAPLVLAGFIWAYRSKKMFFPMAISALFMALELRANHLQITYYLGMIMVAFGVVELVKAIKEKTMPNFIKRTVGLLLMYGFAIGLNFGNVKGTLDYTKYTSRGGSDLTINGDGTAKENTNSNGLGVDYITAWSYGKAETVSFIVPNFKGGASVAIGKSEGNKDIIKEVSAQHRNNIKGMGQYFGEQPFTSGPVYIGVIVVFLAILALFYVKDKIKWALIGVAVFTIMLSWGKNFLGFTEFFLDYLPGYNKFRAVTIILFVAELVMPLLAILFLNQLIKKREDILKNLTPFFVVTGIFFVMLLGFYMSPSTFTDFLTAGDLKQLSSLIVDLNPLKPADVEKINFYESLFNELEIVREEIFKKDVFRSLVYLILGAGVVFMAIKVKDIAKYVLIPALVLLVLIDLLSVDFRYLDKETKGTNPTWIPEWKQRLPVVALPADDAVLEMEMEDPKVKAEVDKAIVEIKKKIKKEKIKGGEASRLIDQAKYRALNRVTNYRVLEYPSNFLNSSRTSYFHKSIGGYHGAKLGVYQDMIDFHLSKLNPTILDMLNMKYKMDPNYKLNPEKPVSAPAFNPNALGNAWFVKSVKVAKNADDEILSTCGDYELIAGEMFEVLLNNEPVKSKKIKGIERISIIVPNQKESVDTIPIQLNLGQKENLAYILGPQGPTWAYADRLDSLGKESEILRINTIDLFEPKIEAVVSADSKLTKTEFTGEGEIELVSYNPAKMEYKSNSSEQQFAVFSEIFIKDGWGASIDGKPVDIVKTNYALRGIEVPAGEHHIVMTYSSPAFITSNITSLLFTILIILLLVFAFYWDFIKTDNTAVSAE